MADETAQQDNTSKLLELARRRFPERELTEPEEKFFRAAATGETADFSAPDIKDVDPARAKEWGKDRTLHAKHIAWLCTDPQASRLVTQQGISVTGARIDGELDLEFARIPYPLVFGKCAFPEGIVLRHAVIPALVLSGTHCTGIAADGLNVQGPMLLREGFKSKGEVRLLGATVGGCLDCINGRLINPGGYALNADGLKVEGPLLLRNGFQSEGEVCLRGAIIGGSLDCIDGRFKNPKGRSLNADSLKVAGPLFLRDGFRSEGEVCLLGTTVGANLECRNGRFVNPGGDALNAERIEVKGNAMLDTGFRAKGQVNLYDARIHGGFKWTWDSSPEEVMLDLQSARIGNLYDKAESWPAKGRLLLNGLVYDEIHEDAPTDAKTRIEWLKRQPADRFRPQPYEQLAAVFRKAGQEADAIKVLVAKGHRRFWAKERWAGPRAIFQQLWHGFLGLTIAYGYRPWRAFWFGVVVVLLGVHLFAAGYEAGMMKPTEKTAAVSGSPNGGLAAEKDSFNAVVYSIDTFLPVVNLYQADFWLPDPNQPGEAQMLRKPNVRFTAGQLRTYLWIHIALGWILTTLLVVGLTGLVRR